MTEKLVKAIREAQVFWIAEVEQSKDADGLVKMEWNHGSYASGYLDALSSVLQTLTGERQ